MPKPLRKHVVFHLYLTLTCYRENLLLRRQKSRREEKARWKSLKLNLRLHNLIKIDWITSGLLKAWKVQTVEVSRSEVLEGSRKFSCELFSQAKVKLICLWCRLNLILCLSISYGFVSMMTAENVAYPAFILLYADANAVAASKLQVSTASETFLSFYQGHWAIF